MMTLEEQMFLLIGSRQFTTASKLVIDNPDMDINALNKYGSSFYLTAVHMSNNTSSCYEFIENVLSHPKFIHHNTTSNIIKDTPFNYAINLSNAILVKTILKYEILKSINVTTNRDQLLYETVSKYIKELKNTIRTSPEKDEIDEKMLENQLEILNLLRAPTIRYAIAQDDLSMLQKLAKLGANLHKTLADGVEPVTLSTPKTNPKSHDWLTQHVKEKIEDTPEFRINKIREANEALEKERNKKQQEILKAHIQERNKNISLFFGIKAPDQNTQSALSNKKEPVTPKPLNNSLFKIQEIEEKIEQVTKEHDKKQKKIILNRVDETESFWEKALNLFKK